MSVRAKTAFREQNCLALGYRAKSDRDQNNAGIRGNVDIECYYVNTIHSMLSGAAWQYLGQMIGEEFLLHVFTRPVFAPSDNGCFLQLSGTGVGQLLYHDFSSLSATARQFFEGRLQLRRQQQACLFSPPPRSAGGAGGAGGSTNGTSTQSNECDFSNAAITFASSSSASSGIGGSSSSGTAGGGAGRIPYSGTLEDVQVTGAMQLPRNFPSLHLYSKHMPSRVTDWLKRN